jgi:hypothetical protein
MSCIEAEGATNNSGYVSTWYKSKRVGAHRAAWMEANDAEIPKGKVVMHSCDNPKCINPAHLRLGSQSENLLDCSAKGRLNTADKNGYNNPRNKQDEAMRELILRSPLSSIQLANQIDLSAAQIRATRRKYNV